MFYYLLLGVSEEERLEFQLKQPQDYFYLNQVNSYSHGATTVPKAVCHREVRGCQPGHAGPQPSPEHTHTKAAIHSQPWPPPVHPDSPCSLPSQQEVPKCPRLYFIFQHNLNIEDGEDLKHDFERLQQAMEMVGFLPATKKQ